MKTLSPTINFVLMLLVLIAVIIISIYSANGQSINSSNYKTAFGLRSGGTSGFTVKQFIGTQSAVEGILSPYFKSFTVTCLYERNAAAFSVKGMKWYYGGGGHIAATSKDEAYYYSRDNRYYYRYQEGGAAFGIDGIFGIEYKILRIPIAVSFDLKPNIEFTPVGYSYFFIDPGLGIKVTF